MKTLAVIFVAAAVCLAAAVTHAQTDSHRLATTARIDLFAAPDVPSIGQFVVDQGGGSWRRMDWLPADQQSRSGTIEFAITHFASARWIGRFTPAADGVVELRLMGPWAKGADGNLIRHEVAWESLAATGAAVSPRFVPSTVWHNEPVRYQLAVKANEPVTLTATARAALPAGFVDMKRLSGQTRAHESIKKFRRGVNLANDLEAPPGQDWGARYDAGDIAQIAAEGFDHVRIPVGWHHYTGPGPEYKISDEIFRKVEVLTDAAAAHRLAVMVNVHHFDAFTDDPARERARFLAIWRQLAQRFARPQQTIALELLNEPKDRATTEMMNSIYEEAIRAIRRVNEQCPIFVGPGRWNQISELGQLRLPDDDENLIVTVHSYEPFLFTHQGARWVERMSQVSGIRYPGPPPTPLALHAAQDTASWVREWVVRYNTFSAAQNPCGPAAFRPALALARQWSDYYGRPMHLGEFGAYTASDPESRARYYRDMRQTCDELGIAWCIWDWKAGFRYWDAATGAPVPGMREALFGTR